MPRALLLGPPGLRELTASYVVTGAGGAIGRAIAERLARHGHVAALDRDEAALGWAHAYANVIAVAGDAADAAVCDRAAEAAGRAAPAPPDATAKAAVEGLTRAAAVDYGPRA